MDPFICEALLFLDFDEESVGLNIFLFKFNEAISCPIRILLIAFFRFFFIEDEHIELIGWANEVETHILFVW